MEQLKQSESTRTPFESLLDKFLIVPDKEAEERTREYEKKQQDKIYEDWHLNCGLDKKFLNAAVGGLMSQSTVNVINKFIKLYNEQQAPILLIMGQVGTGKTYAVASVLNALGAGTFVDMTELKLKITSIGRYSAQESYEDLMHRLARTRLLALDEVGRFHSNQEQEILFYLVNKRYANDMPMILSTNMNGEELAKYLGTAIYDRIKEKCLKIKLDGTSKRINNLEG